MNLSSYIHGGKKILLIFAGSSIDGVKFCMINFSLKVYFCSFSLTKPVMSYTYRLLSSWLVLETFNFIEKIIYKENCCSDGIDVTDGGAPASRVGEKRFWKVLACGLGMCRADDSKRL